VSIKISIRRYDPETDGEPRWADYAVPGSERTTVLEALMHIYEHVDSTLAFRFGCRFNKCGLCAVEVDGKPRMACFTDV
jgi:succinate dehydrogenase/fumarate reductase-like Fe-S protein